MKRPQFVQKLDGFALALALAIALLLLSPGAALAQNNDHDNNDVDIRPEERGTVIRVPIHYDGQTWRTLAAPEIIYCRSPKTVSDPILPAKIETFDANGNVLNRRLIDDPRAFLPEDPRVPWSRANQAELVIEIDLVGAPEKLTFTESLDRNAPDLTLNLAELVQDFQLHGAKRIPNCEQTDPPFVPIRGRDLFVLKYALDMAVENSPMTEGQIIATLQREGRRGVNQIPMREPLKELLLESLFNRE